MFGGSYFGQIYPGGVPVEIVVEIPPPPQVFSGWGAREVTYIRHKTFSATADTSKRRITWRSGSKRVSGVSIAFDETESKFVYRASALRIAKFTIQVERQDAEIVWAGTRHIAVSEVEAAERPALSTVASRALITEMRRFDGELRGASAQVISPAWYAESMSTDKVFLSSYGEGFTDELAFVLAFID